MITKEAAIAAYETTAGLERLYIKEIGAASLSEIDVADSQHTDLEVIPTAVDYSRLPITEAFDWHAILHHVEQTREEQDIQPLYLVVFRSQLKSGANIALLHEHDSNAHKAALESPALIHYFGGDPDEEGYALSFCLWTDAIEAKAISRDSRHAAAVEMVSMYDSYSLEKYDIYHNNEEIMFISRA